jgi:hypothetical protein
VTFWYLGGIGDGMYLSLPAIARYRVVGGHTVLEAPVALTRAGFIHEWLAMADVDAVRWSEPEAFKMRKEIVAASEKHGLKLANIARCGGSPTVWEVGVRLGESTRLYVWRSATK